MSCNQKRRETTIEERKIIIDLFKKQKSLREIASIVGKSHSTIQYIIKKYKDEECVANKPRTGRPKKLGIRDGNFIWRKIKADPTTSATSIAKELQEFNGIDVHAETIRRTLRRNNFHARTARRKPFVSEANRKKRLQFAKNYVDKPISFWEKTVFCDESKYNMFNNDGKKKVWRRSGTAFNKENLRASVKGGGGSVMVWGCMSAKGTGNLHIIDGIMDKFVYLNILKDHLKSSAEKFGILDDYNFYQDNDPKHKSYLVQQWLIYNVPHVIATPAQSPDLNPIEHLWEELERKIRKKPFSNREEWKNLLKSEWENISNEITFNLVQSMQRRLQAVIQAKGNPTKY